MKKKILSLVLTLCMLLGMFPFVVGTSALAVSETDGKVHLTTAEDLLALMGDSTLWDKNIVLENDIDMTGVAGQTPIGNTTTAFTGSFIGVKKADGTNPEIKGLSLVTTTLVNRWGLIGYATGSVTVKNVTISGEMSTAGGGVALVGTVIGGSIVIEDCVNNCTVTSTHATFSRAAGILGISQNAGVSIKNCVNNGTINGVVNVGGIVGRFETTAGKTGITMEIINCINNGTVNSTGKKTGAAGIIASAVDKGGITMSIEGCLNTGAVNSADYCGGILGYPSNAATPNTTTGAHVIKVTDCMNTGKITTTTDYAGGIVGYVAYTKGITNAVYVDRVYNAGELAYKTATNCKAVIAVPRNSVITNAYYSNGPTDAKGTSVTPASTADENKALFPGLKDAAAWFIGDNGPELAAFRDTGDCTHANTHTVTVDATCMAEGSVTTICDDCGAIVGEVQVLPKDENNHVGTPALSLANGKITYTCACGATYTETREAITAITVSANGVKTLPTADPAALGDFAMAMEYAALVSTAAQGVTITIADTAEVVDVYKTPAFAGTITVTGGTLKFTGDGDFHRFLMNGAMTFENLTIEAHAKGIVLAAQNHKLVLGTGITTTGGTVMVVGGALDNPIDGTIAGDVTIRSGAYETVTPANRYDGAKPSAGTVKLTVGKTNAADTLKIKNLFPFSHNGGTLSATSKSIIRVDGEAVIDNFFLNICPSGTVYTDGVLYIVDVLLSGDIQNTDANVADGVNLLYTPKGVENNAVGVINVYNEGIEGASDASTLDADVFAAYLDNNENANLTINRKLASEYCVDYAGGHNFANGVCTRCGADEVCSHDSYHNGIVVPGTCAEAGSEEHICDICGVLFETVPTAKNPNNHVGTDYVWHKNESGAYYYACTGCGTVMHTQTELPKVWLLYNKSQSKMGNDENSGLAAGEEVASLAEAVKRLAEVGGTVYFNGRYEVYGDITLPKHTAPITFAGSFDSAGNTVSGFCYQANNAVLTLGGPTTIDGVVFKGVGANTNLIVAAAWNNVTFGYTRIHDKATVELYAGNYLVKADESDATNQTITLGGATLSSGCDAKTHVFFKRVALGSWFGAADLFISNKKVTLTVANGTTPSTGATPTAKIGELYTMSSTANNDYCTCQTVNCETTVNLYGDTSVKTLRTGDRNVNAGKNYAGTGYLDKQTLNFYDNSVITGAAVFRNVKDTTLEISDELGGRTAKIGYAFQFVAFGTFATNDDMHGTVKANYGEHSFDAAVAKPIAYTEAKYTVNENVAQEHTFGDWVITTPATPDAAGTKTRTCTICGKQETTTYAYDCAYHQWLPVEGGYKCAVCNTTAATLSAPITLKIEGVTIADGKATVTVSLAATEALKGLRFRIGVPAGFTYVSAATSLNEIPAADSGVTPASLSFGAGTDSMVLLNFDEQTLASFEKSNVLTLTYTVSENFTAQSADFTVNLIEVLDDNAASLAADGVGYTWTAAAHEHKFVEEITKAATCGEAGLKTFRCACGESYTEVIPATGNHTFGAWEVTTPAQVGVKGEETRTCAVCGKTETREIPALPEPANHVAYIGNVGYTTVQAAFDAAKALDTITIVAGTTETVTPKTTVYLAGDYSGITIGGAYTLDVTGRYVRRDGAVVSDSKVAFTGENKAIVRLANLTSSGEARGGKTLNLGASVEYLLRPKKTFVDPLADFYVKLELLGTDGKSVEEGSTDSSATTLILSDKKVAETDATRYAYVLDAIPAACMNNTIRYTQYCVNADGTVTMYESNWGASEYFKSMLPSATGALRDLYVALINYGTLAQKQFNYNTENPLSDLLPEADRKLTTADYADIVMQEQLDYTQRTDDNYSFEAFNTTLELLDRINILVTIKSRAGITSDFAGVKAVYSYTDIITGKTITNEVPFENWVAGSVDAKGRMAYRVSINDIAAVNLRQAITLDVVDASGTSIYKFQDISFNAAEYYCALQKGQTSTLATLCYSIMNYCNKAVAYFAK